MIVDLRKLHLTRSVQQHGHFFLRLCRRFLAYPGYTLFMFLLIYLLIMDIRLYNRIRSRNSITFNSNNNAVDIFEPLPIKKAMVEPMARISFKKLNNQIHRTFCCRFIMFVRQLLNILKVHYILHIIFHLYLRI